MLSRALTLVLALATLFETSPQVATPGSDADLIAGIALVTEGDFEGAVVKLDAAVRRLEATGTDADIALAYLYLGVAYLELDQEALARGKFAQALTREPGRRLDPQAFSPQVIRTFEAVRQEALVAEPARDKQAGAVLPSGGLASEERGKRRSALPLILLGGAAAAGGIALATGGGSSSAAPSPTPSSTPTPAPSTSPTPNPTPAPPAACGFGANPERLRFSAAGGTGRCNVTARSDCTWNAEATQPWIQITGGASGRGNGAVTIRVPPYTNNDDDRRGFVRLEENRNVGCEVRQDKANGLGPSAPLSWTSELTVPDGSGKVVVDGSFAALQVPGRSEGARVLPPGVHRVEAVLTSAQGRPGVWRFRLGGIRPGTLRVLLGDAASLSSQMVVFRLRGVSGERVVFTFDAGR